MPLLINKKAVPFEIGTVVYLITDTEQAPRMVTSIKITPNGLIYLLCAGDTESEHYEIEIQTEKPVV